MRIACVNYEPITTYRDQGWSCERLGRYYNPAAVASEVRVMAYGDRDWRVSDTVTVEGYATLADLRRRCASFRPDVIRCYEAVRPNCEYALLTALGLGVPSYLSLHDGRLQYPTQLGRFTVVTAYTETLAQVAAQRLGRPVEVQLNGIDADLFEPRATPSIDPRIAGARHRILTVMRDDPVKNVDTAIKATAILAETLGSVAHVVAGPGSERIPFDGVHLGLGPTRDRTIVDYLSWCSCFLQVQLVGDLGMAATEALMVGRPIVATGDDAGNTRLHVDTSNGVLIPLDRVRDAACVAEALHTCFSREYDYAAIRRRAVGTFGEESLRVREGERYSRLARREASARAGLARMADAVVAPMRVLEVRAGLAFERLRQRIEQRAMMLGR